MMIKQIKAHEKSIQLAIKKLEKESNPKSRAKEIYAFHQDMIGNFQHERLIHLIVTLFFAGLLLLSLGGFFAISSLAASADCILLCNLSLAICIIIATTEIFYIRHYYQLENGVQRLYELSKKLEKIVNSEN